MTNAATVGVIDHNAHIPMPRVSSRNLITKADPTARKSTRTEKIAALFISASFVNILLTSSISYACDVPQATRACGNEPSDLTMAYLLPALASRAERTRATRQPGRNTRRPACPREGMSSHQEHPCEYQQDEGASGCASAP